MGVFLRPTLYFLFSLPHGVKTQNAPDHLPGQGEKYETKEG